MISYGKQSIDQSDIDCVIEVLKSDWLTQGPAVELLKVISRHILVAIMLVLYQMVLQPYIS